jgi:hypothetical protein
MNWTAIGSHLDKFVVSHAKIHHVDVSGKRLAIPIFCKLDHYNCQ